jgi:hypothetical protein
MAKYDHDGEVSAKIESIDAKINELKSFKYEPKTNRRVVFSKDDVVFIHSLTTSTQLLDLAARLVGRKKIALELVSHVPDRAKKVVAPLLESMLFIDGTPVDDYLEDVFGKIEELHRGAEITKLQTARGKMTNFMSDETRNKKAFEALLDSLK